MTEYYADVEDVRSELEGGTDLSAHVIPNSQIETVGIVPAHLEVLEDLSDSDMSEERLELIERYLACDYLLSSDIDALRRASNESQGDGSSTSYEDGHSYRDKAKRLDRTGRLDNLEKPAAILRAADARQTKPRFRSR